MRSLRRTGAAIAMLGVAFAADPGVAATEVTATDSPGALHASPASGPPGTTISVEAVCPSQATIFTFALFEIPTEGRKNDWLHVDGSLGLREDDRFRASVVVPPTARAGSYLLSGTCARDDDQLGGFLESTWQVLDAGQHPRPTIADDRPVDFDAHWTPLQGAPGTTIRLHGKCQFKGGPPGNVVIYLVNSNDTDHTIKAGNDGAWSFNLKVPDNTQLGPAILSISCGEGDAPSDRSDALWRVLPPQTSQDETTSGELLRWAIVVVGCMLAAGSFVGIALHRRNHSTDISR